MSVKIRPAEHGDEDAISALNRLVQDKHADSVPWLFKRTYLDEGAIKSILDRDDTTLFVACANGKVIGYVYGQTRQVPESALTNPYVALHVNHISLLPKYQGQGIGRQLMNHIRDRAKKSKIQRLTVSYWTFNDQAKAFFDSCGMETYLELAWDDLTE